MVEEVDACPSVLAGLELALIHFILAVDTLVSSDTLALVSTQVIPAGGSVLAGAGVTLIQLHLAVAARVTHLALAVVGVPHVQAVTRVLAQLVHGDSSLRSCHLARDAGHVAVGAGPAGWAHTASLGQSLHTRAFVLTGRLAAQIHE